MLDAKLLEVIACPLCQGRLSQQGEALRCDFDKLLFPIEGGIPLLIIDRAYPAEDA